MAAIRTSEGGGSGIKVAWAEKSKDLAFFYQSTPVMVLKQFKTREIPMTAEEARITRRTRFSSNPRIARAKSEVCLSSWDIMPEVDDSVKLELESCEDEPTIDEFSPPTSPYASPRLSKTEPQNVFPLIVSGISTKPTVSSPVPSPSRRHKTFYAEKLELRKWSKTFELPNFLQYKSRRYSDSPAALFRQSLASFERVSDRKTVPPIDKAAFVELFKTNFGIEKPAKLKPESPGMVKTSPGPSTSRGLLKCDDLLRVKIEESKLRIYKNKDGVQMIESGTLEGITEALFCFLLDTNKNVRYAGKKMVKCFLSTYLRITSAPELLELLFQQFNRSSAESSKQYQQGIIAFLNLWLEERFTPDFSTRTSTSQTKKTALYTNLCKHLDTMDPNSRTVIMQLLMSTQSQSGKTLTASADKKQSGKGTISKSNSKFFDSMKRRTMPLPPHFGFLDLSPEELAEQLTLFDYNLFCDINLDEFLKKPWEPAMDSKIGLTIHRWNKTGRWVASEIVLNGSLKQRIEILKRFILLAQACFKMNNFNTAMAITSGLNHAAVTRLKRTWKGLPSKYKEILSALEEQMSFNSSWKNYRKLVAQVLHLNQPTIPFLAVHTKDLLFIEEAKGNPNYVDNNKINFDKLFLIGNVILQLKEAQEYKYEEIEIEPTRAELLRGYTRQLPNTMPEESLYHTSKQNEPSTQEL